MKKSLLIICLILQCVVFSFAISPEEEYDVLYKDLRNISTSGYKATYNYDTGKSDGIPILSQGNLQSTSVYTDFAVLGPGFFKVIDEDGKLFYTRFGNLFITPDNRLAIRCERKKYYYLMLDPLPAAYLPDEIRIYSNGNVEVKYYMDKNSKASKVIGKIDLYDIKVDNIRTYDGILIKTKKEPELIKDIHLVQGTLELSTVYLSETFIRMLFLLEHMDESQVKCKETKIYIIKYLMGRDFQEHYHRLLSEDVVGLTNLNYLDGFTIFLERNYE